MPKQRSLILLWEQHLPLTGGRIVFNQWTWRPNPLVGAGRRFDLIVNVRLTVPGHDIPCRCALIAAALGSSACVVQPVLG